MVWAKMADDVETLLAFLHSERLFIINYRMDASSSVHFMFFFLYSHRVFREPDWGAGALALLEFL